MSLKITPYASEQIPGVVAFNQRLQAGNAGFQFPEHIESRDLPKRPGSETYQEYFIASDGDVVRGGYILKHQQASHLGKIVRIGNYQLPLSEGIVNRVYGMVGVQILFDALKKQSNLYSLGMGGIDRPLPQMLKKLGWHVELVPFYFRVFHAQAFLREIVFLRQKPKFRWAADLLKVSGAGFLAIQLSNLAVGLRNLFRSFKSRAEVTPDFESWADEIWNENHARYQWIGARDLQTLRTLYPVNDPRFIRLKVVGRGDGTEKAVGWALLLATRMKGHKQFGNLYVGSIVDSLSAPEWADDVLFHATQYLRKKGVDIVVSNQSHAAWGAGLKKQGFLQGPSNYGFAGSPGLVQGIQSVRTCHINRGDGDGPINL